MMVKDHRPFTRRSIAAALIIMVLLLTLSGTAPVFSSQPTHDAMTKNGDQVSSLTPNYPSQYFYYPTSNIRILILYDPTTGAQVYANNWSSLLTGFGYNVSILPLQQAIGNASLAEVCDLIIIDHSCGGNYGSAIDLQEARAIAKLGKPIILLGAGHGVIDRLAGYNGPLNLISTARTIQEVNSTSHHPIYSCPYLIPEAGYGAPGTIEVFTKNLTLESYPCSTSNFLNPVGILSGGAKPVVGALYSAYGSSGRLFWWSIKDPSTLNANGCHLFVNTVEWMGGFTDLSLLLSFLEGTESLNSSQSTYWTGGFADYFEPEIPATYYAFSSLWLTGRTNAMNTSALASWLTTQCYFPSQGMFRSPNRYLSPIYWSGVAETGMASKILAELGRMNAVNASRISKYLKSCQMVDGFVRYPGDSFKSTTSTYWALLGLNSTGGLTGINRTGVINYILSCQNLNKLDTINYGGFADHPQSTSSATYTYMALASLNLLGATGSVNLTLVEQWLMNGYVASKGIFYDDHLHRLRYSVNYGTTYSVASLSVIGRLQDIDQTRIADYLSSVQFTDGGWSGANSTDEPLDEITDSYPVILCLSMLGRLNLIRDFEGFVDFVTRCLSPAPSYGFSNLPRTFSNILDTYDGATILNDLGIIDTSMAAQLNASIISSYNSSYTRFSWSRCSFPTSSDGNGWPNVDQPFEFTQLQRNVYGVIIDDLAVQSLLDLGSQNWISAHAQQLWNEIAQCEITTGSSSGYYKSSSHDPVSNLTSGLRYTYHALNCLSSLASFLGYTNSFTSHLTNATKTVNKIMSIYNASAGYFADDGYVLEPYSTTETTYFALASLSLLNGLSKVDIGKTTAFLRSNLYSNLIDTYYSFEGLKVLNKLSTINATRLTALIKSCQKPNGAFESDDASLYRLETTKMAIEILSCYNCTWLSARQTKLIVSSLESPATMHEGSSYLVNLTLVDDHFILPVTNAAVLLRLGTYEYCALETPQGSGSYDVNFTVPLDSKLFGMQNLTLRCSKGTLQTTLNQTSVRILCGEGSQNRTLTQILLVSPSAGEYPTTSNTSIKASIIALNESETPITGVQLKLYVGNSLTDSATSDSSGLAAFSWAPHSSGTYSLTLVYEGSTTLNASKDETTITVNKTPTQITTYSNCSSSGSMNMDHTLLLRAVLLESNPYEAIANASISFEVLTPSGTRTELSATTGENGTALTKLTVGENGSYSIYSLFNSTDYYQGCLSNTLIVKVNSGSQGTGGGANKTQTRTAFIRPTKSDQLTTSNTSVAASISALNESETPIQGVQLEFFVDNSLIEIATSDSSGLVTINWRPLSSGTYNLRIVFEGSTTLNASVDEETIVVGKTPTHLSTYANCSESGLIAVGQTLQLRALLSEKQKGEPIANASITFVIVTPSTERIEVSATTGENGEALILFNVEENGSYTIYAVFQSTDYYSACASNSTTVGASSSSQDSSGGSGEDSGGFVSLVSSMLHALTTPLGLGLVVSSGGLLTASYFLKARREGLDSSNGSATQRRGLNRLRLRVNRRLRRRHITEDD